MNYNELAPYLNKMVRIILRSKQRKIGWLVVDHYHEVSSEPLKEVHCVNVRHGKKLFLTNKQFEIKNIKDQAIVIQIEDILTIRSSL